MKKWYHYLSICEDSTTSLLSGALKHHRVINIAPRMMRAISPTLLWLILSPRKMMPIITVSTGAASARVVII